MEWNEYTNSGIRIKYPSNWQVQDDNLGVKEMLVMISEEPLENACDGEGTELIRNINLAAEIIDLDQEKYLEIKEKPVKILEDHVHNKLKVLEKNIEEFRLLKKENNILNGYLATNLLYSGKYLDHMLKWEQFFILLDKDLIATITATALKAQFDNQFEKIIDKMINTIQLHA